MSTQAAVRFEMPQAVVASDAARLRTKLLTLLESSAPIRIDLSAIEQVDTAGVQVLLAFIRAARARPHPCQIGAPPEPLTMAMNQLGLALSELRLAPSAEN